MLCYAKAFGRTASPPLHSVLDAAAKARPADGAATAGATSPGEEVSFKRQQAMRRHSALSNADYDDWDVEEDAERGSAEQSTRHAQAMRRHSAMSNA
jgi:hypothetical protein